jgi:hypothetical protein
LEIIKNCGIFGIPIKRVRISKRLQFLIQIYATAAKLLLYASGHVYDGLVTPL